ncbi:hypothetical protein H6G36_18630 [Anabaena minutissima FACHB-250]|nr:hypothetical protein [Anabaena minutissima FACHB-250]
MKSFLSQIEQTYVVEVNWLDRWQIYQRLQELDVPCWCEANQPLKVEISSPVAAIQLWSVIRQFTASRQDLISTLKLSY